MSGTVIDEFFAVLGYRVDTASARQAEKSLATVGNSVTELGKKLAGLVIGGSLAYEMKSFIDEADHLQDASDQLGVTTDSLQGLGYAAALSASNLEEVEQAMQFLQRNSQEAAQGNKDLAKSFKAMGVSTKELKNGVPVDELFEKLADVMQKTTNPAKRTALAMQLLGRSGAKLIPLLSQGSAGLEEMKKEFTDLNLGFSKDFIDNSQKVNDNLDRLKFTTRGFASAVGAGLLPALNNALTKLFELGAGFLKFGKNTEMVNALLTIGAAILLAWGVSALWANKAALKLYGTFGLFWAVLDEVFTMLKGGKTLIGDWLDAWGGLGTVDRLVRSIGEGLKIISESGYLKALRDITRTDVVKAYGDTLAQADLEGKIQGVKENIERLKAQKPTQDIDRQVRDNLLRKEETRLKALQDFQFGFQQNTSRATGKDLKAGKEEIKLGTASASAVNEGANRLNPFSEPVIATTNAKGDTVVINQTNHNEVKIDAKTEASPETIAKHVKKQLDERDKSNVEQINALRRKR